MNALKKMAVEWAKSPYARLMRVDKPTGTLLLVFPVLWTIIIAADDILKAALYIPLFCIGAFVMRSAGCVINDMIDVKTDQQVSRTKMRPIASGEIKLPEAIKLLAFLLLIALMLLIALPLNAKIAAGVALGFTIIYPLTKYVTYYAQIVLGFTFNIGVIIAWMTLSKEINIIPIMIYLAAIFWTTGYDTVYALQDRKEDVALGLKSTAIKFGNKSVTAIKQIYLTMIILMALVGLNIHMNIVYYLFLIAATYHLNWQVETLEIDNPENCNQRFHSNVEVGAIILLGAIIGRLW